jgi:signal transduction histidine kinase
MAAYVEEKMQAGDDPKIHYILQEFPDMIQSIRMGADRIADIVSGLKAFSRKDSSIKTAVDLTACLDESLKLTHNRLKYNIAIEKDLTELPPILANHQQIVQVLVNLLVNAADAIGEKDGRIVITARPGNGRVELSISDNGQGIAADVLPKVFDPFFTTKGVGEGTGLGLSITHGIIKDHQGDIQVDSRPGQGTVFRLSLPTE